MEIFGLTFRGLTKNSVCTPYEGKCKFIITVNADFIVRANAGDRRLARLINDNVSTFDGYWPWAFARVRRPRCDIEKISGSDLIFYFSDLCRQSGRLLFIVGGSAQEAANVMNLSAGCDVAVGWDSPYQKYPMSQSYISEFRSQIKKYRPLAVAICLGSPKQEYLIEDQLDFMSSLNVSFVYGAGGTADMVAGRFRRAPIWLQKIGLESVWRLISEPSLGRLRRIVSSIKFFRYLMK